MVELAKLLQDNGAAAIAVHGRTRSMLYSGVADWDTIRAVKQAVSIPVAANGDIFDADAALRCQKRTGADFLMIGRAAFGNPWVFQQVEAALAVSRCRRCRRSGSGSIWPLRSSSWPERTRASISHAWRPESTLPGYLRGVAHSGYYKSQISEIASMEDIYRIAAGITTDLR